jgi:hypothetical protein
VPIRLDESLPRALFGEAAERVFDKARRTVSHVREPEAVRAILDIFERLYR